MYLEEFDDLTVVLDSKTNQFSPCHAGMDPGDEPDTLKRRRQYEDFLTAPVHRPEGCTMTRRNIQKILDKLDVNCVRVRYERKHFIFSARVEIADFADAHAHVAACALRFSQICETHERNAVRRERRARQQDRTIRRRAGRTRRFEQAGALARIG